MYRRRTGRETLGHQLRSRKLLVYAGLCLVFDFNILAYYINDIWIEFYDMHAWGSHGLLLSNHLGFFASNITIISWLLVDEVSWLGKASILLIVSVPLTICGAHITLKYFNYGYRMLGNDTTHHHHHHNQLNTSTQDTNSTVHKSHYSVWMVILGGTNFLEGIVGLVFFVLICMLFDGNVSEE